MQYQIEKEFKVLLTEKQYNFFKNNEYKHIQSFHQKNVYYDTLNNDLSKRKIALRIRTVFNQKFITIKYYENNDLIEIEKEVFVENPFLDDFNVRETLKKLAITNNLFPVVTIHTERILVKGEYAEVCVDKNTFDDNSVDYELEYEVKKPHDDIVVFQSILNKVHITYSKNCASKLARALVKK